MFTNIILFLLLLFAKWFSNPKHIHSSGNHKIYLIYWDIFTNTKTLISLIIILMHWSNCFQLLFDYLFKIFTKLCVNLHCKIHQNHLLSPISSSRFANSVHCMNFLCRWWEPENSNKIFPRISMSSLQDVILLISLCITM